MKLDEHTAQLLDLPQVLERVAERASFSVSRQLVLSLKPAQDVVEARERLSLVSEARKALAMGMELSLGGARDLRPLVRKASTGSALDTHDLLGIRDTLLCAVRIKKLLSEDKVGGRFPGLSRLAMGLDPLPGLIAQIQNCIGDDGKILDQASPALARIRVSLREAHQRVVDRLQEIVSSPRYRSALRDNIVTQREGRYVVPVRVEARSQIPGLVHDQSGSGATLFVEPLEVVELTNRWIQFQRQEEREIFRILGRLSRAVARCSGELERDVAILGEIDRAAAMARYADDIDATEPEIVEPGDDVPLDLRRARHPLIPGDRVVPIDVWLRGFRMLVITGPNTGGKTVTLKTVGLMVAMAMCGLHIPAQSGSRVPAVDAIFADIGDEQGIAQNLSTFSSHILKVARIAEGCTARSLVLLDEIGAGTDPEEGSALGRSILAYLLSRGALVLATSHHRDAKAFAYATEGVENASVEFDVNTLAPTYRLRIGFPGSSHAFTIARRLGLPEEIVAQAEALMSARSAAFEVMLKDLETQMHRLEEARERLETEEKRVRSTREALEARLVQIDREARNVRRETLEKISEEVEQLRERLRALSKAAEAREASGEWLRAALRETQALAQEVTARASVPQEDFREASALGPGQRVWVEELRQEGELVKLLEGKALVTIGNALVSVEAGGLKPLSKPAESSAARPGVARPSPPPDQLNVVGMRTAEAEAEVERYLNRAAMAGLSQVRIVHGVGTGTLRNFLREMLSRHPLVASLRRGAPREGGDGVTIVELNAV
jgi:DNA mismatch repair protein MutS2